MQERPALFPSLYTSRTRDCKLTRKYFAFCIFFSCRFGIPIIFVCGQSMDETVEEARISFKGPSIASKNLYPGCELNQNEIILSLQPREAIEVTLSTHEIPSEVSSSKRTLFTKRAARSTLKNQLVHSLDQNNAVHLISTEELALVGRIMQPIWKAAKKDEFLRYRKGSQGPAFPRGFLRAYSQT